MIEIKLWNKWYILLTDKWYTLHTMKQWYILQTMKQRYILPADRMIYIANDETIMYIANYETSNIYHCFIAIYIIVSWQYISLFHSNIYHCFIVCNIHHCFINQNISLKKKMMHMSVWYIRGIAPSRHRLFFFFSRLQHHTYYVWILFLYFDMLFVVGYSTHDAYSQVTRQKRPNTYKRALIHTKET
jgi:hypothetical protein